MDRFDAMLAFARVVEHSSFTKASDSLNLSATTVSGQVVALERRLGVRLLNRTTRRVDLTDEGAAYYKRVVSLLSELEASEMMIAASNVAPKDRLRIDAPPVVSRLIVIPALASFIERHPGIAVEVRCSDRPVDLASEDIDCVFRDYQIPDDSLVTRKLGSFDMATCASPSYLDKYGAPESPEDAEGHLVCRLVSPRSRRFTGLDFSKDGVRTNVMGRYCAAYNDMETALAGALAGLGIVQLPLYALKEHLATGRLRRILETYETESAPIYVAYAQNRLLSPKVKAFVSWAQMLFTLTEHVTAEP